jgi:AmmeMemoRadiSam system protein B
MSTVRAPAVSGSFYPGHADHLAAVVDGLLADGSAGPDLEPLALVVPHAGYRCSGPVAAAAYRVLRRCRERVRTAVAFGPAHFRDIGGIAVPACTAWRTPLGDVQVDEELRARLVARGLARADDDAHAGEHSVEVQVPFLQRVLAGGWTFLPVVARSVSTEAVGGCIDAVAGDGAMVLVSSDLSHYHDRSTAVALDRRTAEAIVRRDVEAVRDEDACGAEVVRGLLEWARRRDLQVEQLDLGTSADTCSGPDRVVGYGAFAVH